MLRCLAPIVGDERARLMDWLGERCDLPRLQERLMADEVGAYLIAGTDAALVLSVGTALPDNARALWIESLGGRASWKPKDNALLIDAVLNDCEQIGRLSGCSEIRIEAGNRTALKKRLFIKFGFEVLDLGRFVVMRKAL